MSFAVAADSYDQFMGRFSRPLSAALLDDFTLTPGDRALDVGCGTGALTAALVSALGAEQVSAIDPSESFVEAMRSRFPGVDVRHGRAEQLPFPDNSFDLVLAQLVVHFMADPAGGLREMGRVLRPGGTVAASVWDHGGGEGPLVGFWRAVLDLDPTAEDEGALAGARPGQLAELAVAAGLSDVDERELWIEVGFDTFEEWWTPFTLGVGPAGAYVAGLDAVRREALRAHCAERLPEPPFTLRARAWCVLASVA
ncbi:MAG: methyltransferase domain-containing protein [Nocardioides sp.]|uniref:class I SAM-dependent methyltransferase n=1 Tax=Nocardioides sp. TaxID=35761 RepID=UPI0039E21A8F